MSNDRSGLGQEVVECDVREDLRQGKEPFSKIMSAATQVRPGGTLRVFATFEPKPLFAVLGRQGFRHEAKKLSDGTWQIDFVRGDDAEGEETAAPADAPEAPVQGSDGTIQLDNRGLEPPEPLARTLEALNDLREDASLVGLYDRRPMFLLPRLEQMGYTYTIDEMDGGAVRVTIKAGT